MKPTHKVTVDGITSFTGTLDECTHELTLVVNYANRHKGIFYTKDVTPTSALIGKYVPAVNNVVYYLIKVETIPQTIIPDALSIL